MMYIGAFNHAISFVLFDTQSAWVIGVIKGEIEIPENVGEMEKDNECWIERFVRIGVIASRVSSKLSLYRTSDFNSLEDKVLFQMDHLLTLAKEANIQLEEVDVTQQQVQWARDRQTAITTYRSKSFFCNHFKMETPTNPFEFMQAFDDSYDTFMDTCNI